MNGDWHRAVDAAQKIKDTDGDVQVAMITEKPKCHSPDQQGHW